MGQEVTKIPTELRISDTLEQELRKLGFISLVYRLHSDNAVFLSAYSAQRLKSYGDTEEGRAAAADTSLVSQIPYMFVVTRIAHYIKVLQREELGGFKDKTGLENEINKWLSQYVSGQNNPSPAIRSERPLKKARVFVEDDPGKPGSYKVTIELCPHLKYDSADVVLKLVSELRDHTK